MKSQAPALSVRDLKVIYQDQAGPVTALSIPVLNVSPGSLLAITGPSGSGKSTFLYAIAGLLRPSQGEVTWGGRILQTMPETIRDHWRRHTIGFVFQDFHLMPELSPLANVLLPASFENLSVSRALKERALMLLEAFGVPYKRASVVDLSRGEQQRVALARALLFDPPVLLADEPTASLDALAGEQVAQTLEDLSKQEGRTVIVVSHDPALINRIGTRFVLERGQARPAASMELVR
jgi:putative ABC transport system ATP-binding protein